MTCATRAAAIGVDFSLARIAISNNLDLSAIKGASAAYKFSGVKSGCSIIIAALASAKYVAFKYC